MVTIMLMIKGKLLSSKSKKEKMGQLMVHLGAHLPELNNFI